MSHVPATTVFSLILAFLLAFPPAVPAGERIGVVLIHEKNSAPDRGLGLAADALVASGCLVERPEMPWSNLRGFDSPLEEAFKEIESGVVKLRARGAGRIVLVGHSLGAAAAVAYAASRPGVSAVAVLAPAHVPERWRLELEPSVAQAKAMVAKGQGGDKARFADVCQGAVVSSPMRADAYVSYFDPDGPMALSRSLTRLGRGVAVLWAVGLDDPDAAPGLDLMRAQGNPMSRYLEVKADHYGTPDAAARELADWVLAACR